MQYNVPQFVEVEDKIIGPLTIKQFLILLGGGLIGFLLWSLFGPSVPFFLLMVPIGLFFVAIAFAKFNGRPLFAAAPLVLKFLITPRYRVFHRMAPNTPIVKKQDKKKPDDAVSQEQEAAPATRLQELAYLLDQKAAEEDRLIHSREANQEPPAPVQAGSDSEN